MAGKTESCVDHSSCPYVDMITRELDAIHKSQDSTNTLLSNLGVDIALLKYKSGLFGAVAGLVPGVISSLAVYLSAGHH